MVTITHNMRHFFLKLLENIVKSKFGFFFVQIPEFLNVLSYFRRFSFQMFPCQVRKLQVQLDQLDIFQGKIIKPSAIKASYCHGPCFPSNIENDSQH